MKDGEYIPFSHFLIILSIVVYISILGCCYRDELIDIFYVYASKFSNNIDSYDLRTNFKFVKINETRGVRNNNPLNIKYSKFNNWLGKIYNNKKDFDFEEFVDVIYGFRAGYKILITYREKYNAKTIEDIMYRFSPPNENNTEDIITKMEYEMGVKRDSYICLSSYPALLQNMALIESGYLYPISIIEKSLE